MTGSAAVCNSCKTPLKGEYCHHCGEKKPAARDKRLKFFLEETFSAFFFADGKFPQTLKYLLLQPAHLPDAYISGIRKKYLSPIQLFFFANLIYFLVPMSNTFDSSLEIQMHQLPYSRWTENVVTNHLADEDLEYAGYEKRFNAKSTSNSKLILIAMVVLIGLMLQLLFLDKMEYYLVDFFTAAAYLMSFFLLFVMVILPLLLLILSLIFSIDRNLIFQDAVMSISALLLILIYSFFLLRGAFKTSIAGSMWRSLVLMGLIIPSLYIYRFILFWVTFWMV